MGLELKNVTKKFKTIEGERIIFENLNILFPNNGLVAITGESGCGKGKLFVLLSFKRNKSYRKTNARISKNI